jgi:uncharacterized membrane protein
MQTTAAARIVAAVAAALPVAAVLAQASFTPLGDLPGGSVSSRVAIAGGISSDGSTIVGQSASTSGNEAFRWTLATGITGLGDIAGGAFASDATGCSATGLFVCGTGAYDTNSQAFRVDTLAGGGPIGLPFLPSGGYASNARAMSADGNTIVGDNLFSGPPPSLPIIQAFRWTNPASGGLGTQELGFLSGGSFSSTARASSSDGSVIVGWSDAGPAGTLPFRWTSATGMVALEPLPAGGSAGFARSCSADGSVIVGSVNVAAGSLAFRHTGGAFQTLDPKQGSTTSNAADVSADGSVIVGINAGGPSGNIAVIWDDRVPGGWRSLKQALLDAGVSSVAAWNLQRAVSISADGSRIAGDGLNPGGFTEAFLAVLPRPCAADFNGTGGVSVQDIFDFLSAWSAADPSADFNAVGGVTVQDIFDFLTAWSNGCP